MIEDMKNGAPYKENFNGSLAKYTLILVLTL